MLKSYIFDFLVVVIGVCIVFVIILDDCWLIGLIDFVLIIKEDRWKFLVGWLIVYFLINMFIFFLLY